MSGGHSPSLILGKSSPRAVRIAERSNEIERHVRVSDPCFIYQANQSSIIPNFHETPSLENGPCSTQEKPEPLHTHSPEPIIRARTVSLKLKFHTLALVNIR